MMKVIKKLSLHGKIIKWINNCFNNTIERIYCFLIAKNKIGVSFDNELKIDNLMSVVPPLNTFYELATDLQPFEVVNVDLKTKTISIRELGTDTEYGIDSDLFVMLFVKIEMAQSNFQLDKYK